MNSPVKLLTPKHPLVSGFPSGSTRPELTSLGKDKTGAQLKIVDDAIQIVWILFLTGSAMCQWKWWLRCPFKVIKWSGLAGEDHLPSGCARVTQPRATSKSDIPFFLLISLCIFDHIYYYLCSVPQTQLIPSVCSSCPVCLPDPLFSLLLILHSTLTQLQEGTSYPTAESFGINNSQWFHLQHYGSLGDETETF